MSSYHVPGPPRHTFSRVRLLAATVVVAALMGAAMPAFGTITISVDGADLRVARGTTLNALIARGQIQVEPGDLVDSSGVPLLEGGGGQGDALVDGRAAAGVLVLDNGQRLRLVRGTDVVERIVTTQTAIPIPVAYEGWGASLALKSPGTVGLREVRFGEYSGRVESSSTVREPEPMIVRRYTPTSAARVALTFDDGPWPGHTDQILQLLEAHGVRATFFMLGRQVRAHPDIARRVADAGHLVANHSYSHAYLRTATQEQARWEIGSCQNEIERVLGITPTWYRPAGGIVNPAVWKQAQDFDLRLIMWSVDPQDYRATSSVALTQRVVSAVEPGSVILLHDGGGNRSVTFGALATIIPQIKAKGYTFVTLDELYGE